jgi:exopolyphosphatase/guanosine-5'-triphosphate,3'-diphosphate pyrophosphatase
VDATGRLSEAAVERTLAALTRFGDLMDAESVERRKAIATSAARDAANSGWFFDMAESSLGVRPVLLTGDEEARLAWDGAATGMALGDDTAVCDIGGGSTELVSVTDRVSVDIGSVRLTERVLANRPASAQEMADARLHVAGLLAPVAMTAGVVVGIAGTWTSLGAIDMGLFGHDRDTVHGHRIERDRLEQLTAFLGSMSVEETAAIPSLDPKRAPVILAGSIVAAAVLSSLEADQAVMCERDTLDGIAAELLALP